MGVVKKRKRGREAIEAPLWGRVLGRRRAYGPLVVSVCDSTMWHEETTLKLKAKILKYDCAVCY